MSLAVTRAAARIARLDTRGRIALIPALDDTIVLKASHRPLHRLFVPSPIPATAFTTPVPRSADAAWTAIHWAEVGPDERLTVAAVSDPRWGARRRSAAAS